MLPFYHSRPVDVYMLYGCFRTHFSGMVLPAKRRARNGVKRGPHLIKTMTMRSPVKTVLLFSGMVLPARRARNGVKSGPHPINKMNTSNPVKTVLFKILEKNRHSTP
jgi:hypothetical protein